MRPRLTSLAALALLGLAAACVPPAFQVAPASRPALARFDDVRVEDARSDDDRPDDDGTGATRLDAQLARAAEPGDGPRYTFVGLAMSDQSPAFYADIRNLDRLLAHRYGDAYRSILLSNRAPLELERDLPLATPGRIDAVFASLRAHRRSDDRFIILFTTHGAKGALADQRASLPDAMVTSDTLGRWVRGLGPNRTWVLISSCYSGSHLWHVLGPSVVAMTASDDDSASLGCGTLSRGTFFVSSLGRSLDFDHSFDEVWKDTIEKLGRWEAQLKYPGAHPQVRFGSDVRALREGAVSGF